MVSCDTFNAFQMLTEKQVNRLSAKARSHKQERVDKALASVEIRAIIDRVSKTSVEKVKEREVAVLHTSMGSIVIAFYADVAPEHVKSFKRLFKAGNFDHTCFHRIIDGFVIQGGDILTRDDDPLTTVPTDRVIL